MKIINSIISLYKLYHKEINWHKNIIQQKYIIKIQQKQYDNPDDYVKRKRR